MGTTGTRAAPALSEEFTGERIHPRDPGYDAARAVHDGGVDRRPAVVLRPHGAADVIDAVDYARDAGLPLAVRSGGLGIAGSAVVDGGVVLDLSAMKGVHVDIDRGTALAQGGTLWGEYDRETQLFDLATPGGRVGTTGLGGFTLGGGHGWLSPVFGLACDNLVGADVVTADGRFLHVSVDEHQDLLWALRGAGADFGVVTSYELRLHRIGHELPAGLLLVPNDARAGEVVRAYRQVVEDADERLVTALVTMAAPDDAYVPAAWVGRPALAVVVAWIGSPAEGAEAIGRLRRAAPGAVDTIAPVRYAALQTLFDGFAPSGWRQRHRGLHLAGLTDEVLDGFLEVGREIGSPKTRGVLYRQGGAAGRVGEQATAVSHRDAPYLAHPMACWRSPQEDERESAWVRRFTSAVAPAWTGGTYPALEPGAARADLLAGFGEDKLRRLVALKDAWDPGNLFRSHHNIAPTGWQPPAIPRQTRR